MSAVITFSISALVFGIAKLVIGIRLDKVQEEIQKHKFHYEPVPRALSKKRLILDLAKGALGILLTANLILIGLSLP